MRSSLGIDPSNPVHGLTPAMRTTPGRHRWRQGGQAGLGWAGAGSPQDRSGASHVALAPVIGQEAVMADAHQAGRQDVPTEAADEFDGAQGQRLHLGALPVIAVSERDALARSVQSDQATVAQGHAVRVVGQISQDLFRTTKGSFGIKVPALGIKVGKPGASNGTGGEPVVGQAQKVRAVEEGLETGQELAPKKCGQGADWKKKFPLLGRAPALS